MKTAYVALLSPDHTSGRILASVPDVSSCVTSGKDYPDALNMVSDALQLVLVGMEDVNLPIPEPTPIESVNVPVGSYPTLVPVDTAAYRKFSDDRAVRKNISMPSWMAVKIDQLGINLSQFVQDSLRAQFGL